MNIASVYVAPASDMVGYGALVFTPFVHDPSVKICDRSIVDPAFRVCFSFAISDLQLSNLTIVIDTWSFPGTT